MAFRAIRDVWRRYRNFGNPELEELKGKLIQLRGDVEKMQQLRKLQAEHEEKVLLFQLRKVVQAFSQAEKVIDEEAKKVRKSCAAIEDEVKTKFTELKTARIMANTEHLLRTVDVGKFLSGVPLEECIRKPPNPSLNPSPNPSGFAPLPLPSVSPAAEGFAAVPGSTNPNPNPSGSVPLTPPSVPPAAQGFPAVPGSSNPTSPPTPSSALPVEGHSLGESRAGQEATPTLSQEDLGVLDIGAAPGPSPLSPAHAEAPRPSVIEGLAVAVNPSVVSDTLKQTLGHADSPPPEVREGNPTVGTVTAEGMNGTEQPEGFASHGGVTWPGKKGGDGHGDDGSGHGGAAGNAGGFPGDGKPPGSQVPPAGGATSASTEGFPGGGKPSGSQVPPAGGAMSASAGGATSASAHPCGLATSAHGHASTSAAIAWTGNAMSASTSAAIAWTGNALSAPKTSGVTATSPRHPPEIGKMVIPLAPLHKAETLISSGDLVAASAGFPAHFGEVTRNEGFPPMFSVPAGFAETHPANHPETPPSGETAPSPDYTGGSISSPSARDSAGDLVPAGCLPPGALAVRAATQTGLAVQWDAMTGLAVQEHAVARGLAVRAGAETGIAVHWDVTTGLAVQDHAVARGVAVQCEVPAGMTLHVGTSRGLTVPQGVPQSVAVQADMVRGVAVQGTTQKDLALQGERSGQMTERPVRQNGVAERPARQNGVAERPAQQNGMAEAGWAAQWPEGGVQPHEGVSAYVGAETSPEGRYIWREGNSPHAPVEEPVGIPGGHNPWREGVSGYAGAGVGHGPSGRYVWQADAPTGDQPRGGGGGRVPPTFVLVRQAGPAGAHVWSAVDPPRGWSPVGASPPGPPAGNPTGGGFPGEWMSVENLCANGVWYAADASRVTTLDNAPARNREGRTGEGVDAAVRMGDASRVTTHDNAPTRTLHMGDASGVTTQDNAPARTRDGRTLEPETCCDLRDVVLREVVAAAHVHGANPDTDSN